MRSNFYFLLALRILIHPYVNRTDFHDMKLKLLASAGPALLVILPALSGCALTNHQIVNAQAQDCTPVQIDTKPISAAILSELAISSNTSAAINHVGPQLVAGDWIAWQCAIAANYWDLPTKNAPAFAEAVE